MAAWLHSAARQHLRACLPQPTAGGSQAGSPAAGPTLGASWLLNAMAVLDGCGGFREAADLLCDLLAALLRAVAIAAANLAAEVSKGERGPCLPSC